MKQKGIFILSYLIGDQLTEGTNDLEQQKGSNK